MVTDNHQILVRSAQHADRRQLTTLIHFGTHVHRHLDWRPPLDWVGHQPYVVAEWNYHLVAALACPPDPIDVAWIRLFAVTSEISIQAAWSSLWEVAQEKLSGMNVYVAAMTIPLNHWFQELLEASQFVHSRDVIMLRWERSTRPPTAQRSPWTIRSMEFDDLPAVQKVDAQAFSPVWRNSLNLLEMAWSKAAIATVAEDQSGIIGYQISMANSAGGHLARLAVDPRGQGHGIGYALVQDMLIQFHRWGAQQVTVNTQTDNTASLSLYEKAGFRRTGDIYPVYQMNLKM